MFSLCFLNFFYMGGVGWGALPPVSRQVGLFAVFFENFLVIREPPPYKSTMWVEWDPPPLKLHIWFIGGRGEGGGGSHSTPYIGGVPLPAGPISGSPEENSGGRMKRELLP